MRRLSLVIPVFGATLFSSAVLLFWVEPMFAKMLLPLLGGAPAIWVTAMLFYQMALLVGYAYAHVTSHFLRPTVQAVLHLALLVAAMVVLPIAVPAGWTPPAGGNPVGWMLGLLTVALGAPFVLLAATAPIVQRWFASTTHPQADNPYFLYAVSNAGSLLGLFAYPFLLEPHLRLVTQSHAWSSGFFVLVVLVGLSAALARRFGRSVEVVPCAPIETAPSDKAETQAIGAKRLLMWVLLAAVPSSLMLSVTSFISTDIAAIPLMWIVPLALYLVTFIIAFSSKPVLSSRFVEWLQPFLVILLCITFVSTLGRTGSNSFFVLLLHLAVFFVCALVCHFELMRLRPPPRFLTAFYLALSFGGVLGGAFNVLVAPFAFNDVYEYPIGLVLVCLLRPKSRQTVSLQESLFVFSVGLIVLAVMAWYFLGGDGNVSTVLEDFVFKAFLVLGVLFLFAVRHDSVSYAGGVAVFLLVTIGSSSSLLYLERSFFGVVRVRDIQDKGVRMLEHGTTVHGVQALDQAQKLEPLSYYSHFGGMGEVLLSLEARKPDAKVGVIGLGTGSLACYGTDKWHYTFYEIDPVVVKVASDPALFSYLTGCGRPYDIIIGDGRLEIGKAPDGTYDVIVLDAFSSDVIPLHLLTKEAMNLYLSKLAEDGILVLHLSNRYFDLAPVVTAMARELGLTSLVRLSSAGEIEGTKLPYTASIVAAVSREPKDLAALASKDGWKPIPVDPSLRSWTDDYSNLLSTLGFARLAKQKPVVEVKPD